MTTASNRNEPGKTLKKQRVIKTRVFRLWDEKYQGDGEMVRLAQATGISPARLYRVRRGARKISATFIVGVAKALHGYEL